MLLFFSLLTDEENVNTIRQKYVEKCNNYCRLSKVIKVKTKYCLESGFMMYSLISFNN